jgi:hypothetical protein
MHRCMGFLAILYTSILSFTHTIQRGTTLIIVFQNISLLDQ